MLYNDAIPHSAGIQTARTLIREPDFVNKIKAKVAAADATARGGGSSRSGSDGRGVGGVSGGGDGGASSTAAADVASKCTNCNACVVATLGEGVLMRCPLRDLEDLAAK